jgi:hypothetical protein
MGVMLYAAEAAVDELARSLCLVLHSRWKWIAARKQDFTAVDRHGTEEGVTGALVIERWDFETQGRPRGI